MVGSIFPILAKQVDVSENRLLVCEERAHRSGSPRPKGVLPDGAPVLASSAIEAPRIRTAAGR